MNIRKTLLTTTLFFAGTATALLADNGKAIEFYKTGRIEPAKAMLLQNLATAAGRTLEPIPQGQDVLIVIGEGLDRARIETQLHR